VVPRGTPGYPGEPRGTSGNPGEPRGTRGTPRYPGFPPCTPGYPGVPRGTGVPPPSSAHPPTPCPWGDASAAALSSHALPPPPFPTITPTTTLPPALSPHPHGVKKTMAEQRGTSLAAFPHPAPVRRRQPAMHERARRHDLGPENDRCFTCPPWASNVVHGRVSGSDLAGKLNAIISKAHVFMFCRCVLRLVFRCCQSLRKSCTDKAWDQKSVSD
jgi:hypothetical protein